MTNPDSELDRELALNHGPAYFDCHKVKIGKRTLKFFGHKDQVITFAKGSCNGQSLDITFECFEEITEKCSLGHFHVKERKEKNYERFGILWEHVEQLVEWINHGSWHEVQGNDPENKLWPEVIEFIKLVEKTNDQLKPVASRLRRRIQDKLGMGNQ